MIWYQNVTFLFKKYGCEEKGCLVVLLLLLLPQWTHHETIAKVHEEHVWYLLTYILSYYLLPVLLAY